MGVQVIMGEAFTSIARGVVAQGPSNPCGGADEEKQCCDGKRCIQSDAYWVCSLTQSQNVDERHLPV